MIEIKGDQTLIDVQTRTEHDSNMNNYQGGNKLVVDVQPGWQLIEMQRELENLKVEFEAMKLERETEEALRKTNPALKDMYDQYQVVFKLVKKADAAEKDINGNG